MTIESSVMLGRCRFETELGTCGMAWSSVGILRVILPGDDRLNDLRGWPLISLCSGGHSAVGIPLVATQAIAGICSLLAGRPADLAAITIDLSGKTSFSQRVSMAARTIPAGRTTTYAGLAVLAGSPGSARAVGQVMARNPVPLLVPCHRVLGSNGALGGFSAAGGLDTKRRLLAIEAAAPKR
jgi:methylated-DNA-[protein]-cysteine S-methyltransferase